jgi:hypothetical protein
MNDELNNNLTQRGGGSTVATLENQQPPVDDYDAVAPASLAQMLVEAGILAPDQVMRVQEVARRERETLGRILVRDGIIMSRDLATLTAVYLGLTMVDLKSEAIDDRPHRPSALARPHRQDRLHY